MIGNPVGQYVRVGRIAGRVATIVVRGECYMSDIRGDKRVPGYETTYKGESFAVVIDDIGRAHHVGLSEI